MAPEGISGSTKPHDSQELQHENQHIAKLNHKILTFFLRMP
jgi:hypothetical protein